MPDAAGPTSDVTQLNQSQANSWTAAASFDFKLARRRVEPGGSNKLRASVPLALRTRGPRARPHAPGTTTSRGMGLLAKLRGLDVR